MKVYFDRDINNKIIPTFYKWPTHTGQESKDSLDPEVVASKQPRETAMRLRELESKATQAAINKTLQNMLDDPNAPQEVKDYKNELARTS